MSERTDTATSRFGVETIGRSVLLAVTSAICGLAAISCGSNSSDIYADPPQRADADTSAEAAGPAPADEPDDADIATVDIGSTPRVGFSPAEVGPSIDLTETDLSRQQIDDLLKSHNEVVALLDAARLGDDDALSELEQRSTTPLVAASAEEWRQANEGLVGDGLSVGDLRTTSSVFRIEGTADNVLVRDCMAVEVLNRSGRLTYTALVDQLMAYKLEAGRWAVQFAETMHEGTPAASGWGCVPGAERSHIEQLLHQTLGALQAAWADPVAGSDPLAGYLSGDFLLEAQTQITNLAAQGVFADGQQDHAVRVLGSDAVSGSGAYVVATCTHFPQGFPLRSIETGAILSDRPPPAEPGTVIYREWDVRRLVADEGQSNLVVSGLRLQDVNADCGLGEGQL